ncbi:MAG: DUF6512 family protein [Bacillota bacterium]|nr:DUF6512 family protein [Bacillota bacterium]
MEKKWKFIAEILFILILGTLLHFTYEFFNYNKVAAIFSAVNESTWEHLKLVYMPFFLLGIASLISRKKSAGLYVYAKGAGAVIGSFSVIIIFYTYTGIIGRHFLVLDIITFVIAVFIGFYIYYGLVTEKIRSPKNALIKGLIIFCLTFLLFLWSTFDPPHINLFMDPTNGSYGID